MCQRQAIANAEEGILPFCLLVVLTTGIMNVGESRAFAFAVGSVQTTRGKSPLLGGVPKGRGG
jgi:hypothetical protein